MTEPIAVDGAFFNHVRDTRPQRFAGMPFWRLGELLLRHDERDEKDGRLWSPARYRNGITRGDDGIVAVTALVFDFDHEIPPWGLFEDRFAFLAHTTWRHWAEHETCGYRPQCPHWRVAFPLTRSLTTDEYNDTWQRTVNLLCPNADEGAKGAARMLYLPTRRPGVPADVRFGEGEAIDPDRLPPLPPVEPGPTYDHPVNGDRPGDRFNAEATWNEILEPHGWMLVYERDQQYWRRPGKDDGISATANTDCLYVFSSNAQPFEANRGYSRFSAHALLNHGGDFRAAAKELARRIRPAESAEKEVSLTKGNTRSEVSPEASPLHRLDVKTMLETEPEPTDWLADRFAARAAFTIFGGREKRGKSMVLMAIAVTAASGGGRVGGIEVKAARVLIIDAENGKKLIHARLRALGLRSDEHIEIYEARGFELRNHLQLVREKIRAGKFDLIVLDSYRSLWLGDERDERENVEALDPLRNLAHDENVAIVLSHHAQKGGEEYRGSSAIGACVDWLVMIEKVHGDDDRTRKRLTVPLPRIDAEPDPRWIRIESDGATITISNAEEYEGATGQSLEAVVRTLKAYNSNNEWRSADWGALACADVCAESTFKRKHLSELKKRRWVETTTLAKLREDGFNASPDADGRETWFRFTDDWWLLNWSSTHE